MKKIFVVLLAFMTITTLSFAQKIQIHTKSGVTQFNLADIDSITFSTTTTTVGDLHDPILEVQFDEDTPNHNMHITSDGNYYYTINGGQTENGQINKFGLDGVLIKTYSIGIDGRGLSYNKADGFLYASLFGGDIVKITSLENGTWEDVHKGIMQSSQASFAISPDGKKFYDFSEGTLNIRNFATGAIEATLTGLSYGGGNYGGNSAVAVDGDFIYTWNAYSKTVYVYDNNGNAVRTMTLSDGDNGQSLSYVDGYLFVSKDGNYGVGTWYGYNIRNEVPGKPVSHKIKATSRVNSNPAGDTTK